ncbi:hypothetical protein LCGC14_2869440, partial [marine sediment metagenome]
AVHEVKRLELPELDEDFAAKAGFDSVEEMTKAARGSLEARTAAEQIRLMGDQVKRFFLNNTELEVPEGASERQTARLLQRQAVDLMVRGVPRDQIEQNLEELEKRAAERAAAQLKIGFILAKVSEAEKIEVSEDEVNARIAQMARYYRRRPERLRQEMRDDGTLSELRVALVEEKVIDAVLAAAKIVDVKPGQDEDSPDETPSEKPEAKKAKSSGTAAKKKSPAKDNAQADKADKAQT